MAQYYSNCWQQINPILIDVLNEIMQDYGYTAKLLSNFELLNQVLYLWSLFPFIFHGGGASILGDA